MGLTRTRCSTDRISQTLDEGMSITPSAASAGKEKCEKFHKVSVAIVQLYIRVYLVEPPTMDRGSFRL